MISAGRIIAGLIIVILVLGGALVSLSLRLPDPAEPAPTPTTTLRLDPTELQRLRSSLDAQSAEIARLRESLLGVGPQPGVAADPRLAALDQRLARAERDLQEALSVLRPMKQLVDLATRQMERERSAYAPPGPLATPTDPREQRRFLATRTKNDLRLIDAAIDQYCIEFNVGSGYLQFQQLKRYFKPGSDLEQRGVDPLGAMYGPTFKVGDPPRVSPGTKAAFRDVVDDGFWSPFQ